MVDEDAITIEAIGFFKSLLLVEPISMDNDLFESIPSIILDEDNKMLMAPFMINEVKEVVFSIGLDKAPCLDGFTALFYQKCREFVGSDLLLALE